MNDLVSKLEFASVRTAFKSESGDFTAWMEENIDALSDRIGLKLEVLERETKVGDFRVDLLCQDEFGRRVIVENQLERSDHSHLGQVLTYMVNLDAKIAIWITPEPRQEHEKVIDWLNEVTPDDISFYLIKVEIVRIGESARAPLFSIISRPDSQAKVVGEKKKELSEKKGNYKEFWAGLLPKMNTKSQLFNKRSPGMDSWFGAGAGKSGVTFQFWIRKTDCGVDLYVDYDQDTGLKNKKIYDLLFEEKAIIESEIGHAIRWWRLDHKRASIISATAFEADWTDRSNWPEMQDKMVELMLQFEKAFKNRLKKINV